jgi:hypothetical protein
MMGISTGEKLLLTLAIGGVAISAIFSTWIINQGIKEDQSIDYIKSIVSDIKVMMEIEQRVK